MRTTYETLNELESRGELKNLVYCGVLSINIINQLEVYRFIDARIKTGSKKTDAINEATVKMKVCRTTVFKILRTLNYKNDRNLQNKAY